MESKAIESEKNSGYEHDYRTFHQNGDIVYGRIGDSFTADLVIYIAGNQFMSVAPLMRDFQEKNRDIKTIYVETVPPGQILDTHILQAGEVNGQPTAQNPDLYGSVNIAHLAKLKAAGLMDEYIVYMHNKLALMVAKGNPKGITGPQDLGRDDLIQAHPNPLTEGILKFYGIPMLKQLGLYEKVTGGKACKNCWAIENRVWFTDRHHREIPYRIEKELADVGLVWATEIAEAEREGRQIEGVPIPAPLNKQEEINYVMGPLKTGRNSHHASRYLSYLASQSAQSILVSCGFVRASAGELAVHVL